MFLPNYRAWVIVASLAMCLATWFVIEKTRLGAYLRAATENPALVQAFGINVPRHDHADLRLRRRARRLRRGDGGADLPGEPAHGRRHDHRGVRGGGDRRHGLDHGLIVTGFGLGVVEGLTKVFYPEASNTVIFIIMAIVLLIKPAGLFGTQR